MTVSQLAGRWQLGKIGSWGRMAVGEEPELGRTAPNSSWGRMTVDDDQKLGKIVSWG